MPGPGDWPGVTLKANVYYLASDLVVTMLEAPVPVLLCLEVSLKGLDVQLQWWRSEVLWF